MPHTQLQLKLWCLTVCGDGKNFVDESISLWKWERGKLYCRLLDKKSTQENTLKLLLDMNWTLQFLRTFFFFFGGACMNRNVRVRRAAVSADFLFLASWYTVHRHPGEVNPRWIHRERVGGLMMFLTRDRQKKHTGECCKSYSLSIESKVIFVALY